MQSNYWSYLRNTRIGRRRLLASTSAAGLGAAFLAACGGDDGDGDDDGAASDRVAPTSDSSREAKRGGNITVRLNADLSTMDPHLLIFGALNAQLAYGRLFRAKPGLNEPASGDVVGDMVKSWEFSPDNLKLTMKLQDNNKWHNVPPVNGRDVVAEDIVASWGRYVAQGQTATNYSNEKNPGAPVVRMTAVDAKTVVMDLARPNSGVTRLFGTGGGGCYFVPREGAAGAYDLRNTAIGSGPWYLEKYEPSVRADLKRHEGWYDAEHVYADSVTQYIIPEYASTLAQFEAGSLLWFQQMLQEDVLASKSRLPELELRVQEPPTQYSLYMFGHNPETGSPWADKRVRQALARSLDREVYFDAFWNREKFAAEGIPIKTYNSTPVVPIQGGDYWLDPNGKDFGPNAKYFQRDIAEAKKLLSAAGFPTGLKSQVVYTPDFGEPHVRQVQMIVGFAQEAGIEFGQTALPNVNSDFRPKYIFTQGNFNALAFTLGFNRGILDPVEMSASEYIPSSAIAFSGFAADGQPWKSGDPAYTDLLTKARGEFDEKKRLSMMQDFQRMEAENQYMPSFPGTAEQLVVSWPALRNINFFRSNLTYNNLWIDSTRAPLKTS